MNRRMKLTGVHPGRAGASPLPPDSSTARPLGGRSLVLARATWGIVAALAVSLFVAGLPVEFALLHEPCPTARCTTGQLPPAGLDALEDLGLSPGSFAAYFVALDVVFAMAWFAVAALIFWRRSDSRMGLFVSLTLLTFGTATFAFTLGALVVRHPAWGIPVAFLHFFGSASFGLFLYLFPDGRFVPRWTRWVALAWIAWQLPPYFFPGWHLDPGAWYLWAQAVVWPAALGTALYSQAYRYRRVSDAKQRQQIKWVVFGISVALAIFIGTNLGVSAFASVPTSPGTLAAFLTGYLFIYAALLLIPLSIGIAILRHHLFDIDLIIRRTLVYGALTASVVGLYVLVVGGLGVMLQVRGNLLVSILAAGLVAVLFQPLRERLQRDVNRLLYGDRDDPYAVLSRLGSRLESRLAPDAVLPAVTRTVRDALKLPYAEIQLRREDRFETAAVAGSPVENPLRLPLVYGGETVGRLVLGPRAGQEGFPDAERRLLEDLAHQIGAPAHAAIMTDEALRLSADLQRSRERLVEAREEERRRLRRDLHDGLGPQLSSQALTVDAVRALMRRDPDAAEELLLDLKSDAQNAVTDIRRLVYGLRPPALDDLGLLGALRETAAQYDAKGLRVAVEAPERLPSLSAAVEVAAYRIAQEALTNVARHAGARSSTVSLALDGDGALRVEVSDDGVGMPDPHAGPSGHAGVGLTSMRERATELGGSLDVEELPEGGTRVRARLPLPEEG
ncbi:sensor histidine kinase [Rubrobacter tropicus]|uniref:Sensor histidine kinase n=1 Tax=Rubrobacter tropicus TaxID=2653851 RepID=A0A6G8Q9Y9_9ACTN|nr:histidine kinase [Rubrobacter tropicus]QIN83269.1 sensor histidine kinase [Rubrobacter tropicus]